GAPVEAEALRDFAGPEGSCSLQTSVVSPLNVISIAITRPPTHHVIRRRDTRTLTRAAGIVDFLDFALTQRAPEDLYFVNETTKVISWSIIQTTGTKCPADVNRRIAIKDHVNINRAC